MTTITTRDPVVAHDQRPTHAPSPLSLRLASDAIERAAQDHIDAIDHPNPDWAMVNEIGKTLDILQGLYSRRYALEQRRWERHWSDAPQHYKMI